MSSQHDDFCLIGEFEICHAERQLEKQEKKRQSKLKDQNKEMAEYGLKNISSPETDQVAIGKVAQQQDLLNKSETNDKVRIEVQSSDKTRGEVEASSKTGNGIQQYVGKTLKDIGQSKFGQEGQSLLQWEKESSNGNLIQEEFTDPQQEHLLTKQDSHSDYRQSWKISYSEIKETNVELGKGGWGFVRVGIFRAQKVAVKQVYQSIVNKKSVLNLVHQEIDTMANVRHPNLLLFIGAAFDHPSGCPLIVMELMEISLRQAIEQEKISDSNCVKIAILRDVAVALNYLHCHKDKIIHRDVSSNNVLLESRVADKWRAKVSDFGSASKAHNAFTRLPGAAVYSAPESMSSIVDSANIKPLTTKMDVFSFGVLVCEVFSNTFPDFSVFEQKLREIQSDYPPIGKLITKCTETNPEDRPTMQQVTAEFDEQYIVGELTQ